MVLPDRDYIAIGLKEYDSSGKDDLASEEVFGYDFERKPWPALRSYEEWVYPKNRNYSAWLMKESKYSDYQFLPGPIDETGFKLAAFGLPEPKTIPNQYESAPRGIDVRDLIPGTANDSVRSPLSQPVNSRFPYWIFGVIVAVLLVGIAVFQHRSRRSKIKDNS